MRMSFSLTINRLQPLPLYGAVILRADPWDSPANVRRIEIMLQLCAQTLTFSRQE
uniref:Uncharacterized protein n=1 Tax=Anguilla anguilla TaxID=7936 RepID=A0A0E9RHS7_ANGAN